jgi:hypothetical protein
MNPRQNFAAPLPGGCFDIFRMDLASDPELHITCLSGELDSGASPEFVAVVTAAEERTVVLTYGTSRFPIALAFAPLRGETADRDKRWSIRGARTEGAGPPGLLADRHRGSSRRPR